MRRRTGLNSKIKEIITHYNLSDRQFSLKIGVNPSVIGSMFQKGTEPSAKVICNTLLNFPDISADWFLRDMGEMFRAEDNQIKRMDKFVDKFDLLPEAVDPETAIDIHGRLKEILAYSKLSTMGLAKKCNVNQVTLDRQIKGTRGINVETLIAICVAFPEISTEWLLLGKGDMLKELNNINNKYLDTIAKLNEALAAQGATIKILRDRIKN